MCGIAGIFDKVSRRPISLEKLNVLSTEIQHRGRDDVGYFTDDGCGLAHRRLSIVDLDGGKQPMKTPDNTIVLTFNGMIYNYIELRKKLEFAGHIFKTNSDTEVLLNSYIAWGTECVKYFDGFFAFAIYDKNKDMLFCARDVLGKKPFYYYIDDSFFFHFASDLTALLEIMPEKPAVSIASLEDYLTYGFIPEPKTLFDGLYKLDCGHSIVIKRGVDGIHFSDFSKQHIHKNFNTITDYEQAKTYTELLLNNAVEKRLIADVPIGTLLSGGLDSGLITAMIANKTDNMTAFTASFDDNNLDEAEAAQSLAKHLGIKHSILKITDMSESIIDDIAVVAGEPFADAAMIPLFLICDQAKAQVKVLLSGDGGDELFAGYRRYDSFIKQEKIKSLLSLKSRQFLFKTFAEHYPQTLKLPKFLRFGATFDALATTPAGGYLRNIAITRPQIVDSILSETSQQSRHTYRSVDSLIPFFKASYKTSESVFNDARYCDIKYWLPSRMLVKADRASMAASIELRCPLLDLDLTEYALHLPYEFLHHASGGKKILRDIAEKYLPKKHLMRPKQGFVMNISHLLKTDWATRLESVVHDSAFVQTNLLNMQTVKNLMHAHFKGYADHSRILWAIIQLEAYLRIHKFI